MRWVILAIVAGLAAVAVGIGFRKRKALSSMPGAMQATDDPIVRVRIVRWVPNPAYTPYLRTASGNVPSNLPRETPRAEGTRDYKLSEIPYPSRIEGGLVVSIRRGRSGEYEGPPVREIVGGVEKWAVWRRGSGGSGRMDAAFSAVVVVAATAATVATGNPAVGAGIATGAAALRGAAS